MNEKMATIEAPDELIVKLSRVPLLEKCKERIEDMYEVTLELGIIVVDDSVDKQWITIMGEPPDRRKAKDYIKALCNPEEVVLVDYPGEMHAMLTSKEWHRTLEQTSNAAIVFVPDFKAQILGTDITVTLAFSKLDDLIKKHRNPLSEWDSEKGVLSTGARVLERRSDASVRLDLQLLKLCSTGDEMDFADYSKLSDSVKRAVVSCYIEDSEDEAMGDGVDSSTQASSQTNKQEERNVLSDPQLVSDPSISTPQGIEQETNQEQAKCLRKVLREEGYPAEQIEDMLKTHLDGCSEFKSKLSPNQRRTDELNISEDGLQIVGIVCAPNRAAHLDLSPTERTFAASLQELSKECSKSDDNCTLEELRSRNEEREKLIEKAFELQLRLPESSTQGGAKTIKDKKSASKDELGGKSAKNQLSKGHKKKSGKSTGGIIPRHPDSMEDEPDGADIIVLDDSGVESLPWQEVTYASKKSKRNEASSSVMRTGERPSTSQGSPRSSKQVSSASYDGRNTETSRSPLQQKSAKRGRVEKRGPSRWDRDSTGQYAVTPVPVDQIPLPPVDQIPLPPGQATGCASDQLNSTAAMAPIAGPSSRRRELIDKPSLPGGSASHNVPYPASQPISTAVMATIPGPSTLNSVPPLPPGGSRRHIVIDGSNVAFYHGKDKCFSCKGIQICVDFFRSRGHQEITAFVPDWRRGGIAGRRLDKPVKDKEILTQLCEQGFLVFTPCRRVKGKNVVHYDDRFVVRLAAQTEGIIVSNDHYRDLLNESTEFKKTIEDRLLLYRFVGDIFMPVEDPGGRQGPSLDQFLLKTPFDSNSQYVWNGSESGTRPPKRQEPNRFPAPKFNAGHNGRSRGGGTWRIPPPAPHPVVPRQPIRLDYHHKPGPALQGPEPSVRPPSRRSAAQTEQLQNQLKNIFPDHPDLVLRVLSNHGDENDLNKLSTYVLNII